MLLVYSLEALIIPRASWRKVKATKRFIDGIGKDCFLRRRRGRVRSTEQKVASYGSPAAWRTESAVAGGMSTTMCVFCISGPLLRLSYQAQHLRWSLSGEHVSPVSQGSR
jgi:hypothetical protein